jgi:hypothetical protein
MPHGSNKIYTESFPNVTHSGDERYIAEIGNNTLIGYKYFRFSGEHGLAISVRGCAGKYVVSTETEGSVIGEIDVPANDSWQEVTAELNIPHGVYPIYLRFCGEGLSELKMLRFF